MNWMYDSPITILLGGIAMGFFIGVAWIQTGRNAFLYAIGGVAVGTLLLLVLERYIETPGEKVRRLLYVIASEIENNDADRVVKHIVSSKPELAAMGKAEMSRYKFREVTITKIFNIIEQLKKQPPQVVVEFNVSVGGDFIDHNAIVFFRLTFWQDHDGEWRIADYEYDLTHPYPRSHTP